MPPQVEDDGRGSGTTGRCPCPAENVPPIISACHLLSAAPCSSVGNRRCLQLLCDAWLPSMSPADRIANTNERVPHFAIIPPSAANRKVALPPPRTTTRPLPSPIPAAAPRAGSPRSSPATDECSSGSNPAETRVPPPRPANRQDRRTPPENRAGDSRRRRGGRPPSTRD